MSPHQVKTCGQPMPVKDELDFSTPFGPTQGGRGQGQGARRAFAPPSALGPQHRSSSQGNVFSPPPEGGGGGFIQNMNPVQNRNISQNMTSTQNGNFTQHSSSSCNSSQLQNSCNKTAEQNINYSRNSNSSIQAHSSVQETVNSQSSTSTHETQKSSFVSSVTAQSILQELEATPSRFENNITPAKLPTESVSKPNRNSWAAPCSTAPRPKTDFSLEAPQPPPSSSPPTFQLQRPRNFQPSPATARRMLPASQPSQQPPTPETMPMQFAQQKEMQFNSVSKSSSTQEQQSFSSSVQSDQLEHAICNMTETLASFKADVELVDLAKAEHVEQVFVSYFSCYLEWITNRLFRA